MIPYLSLKFSYFIFFLSHGSLLDVLGNLQMSNFHKLQPYLIWSYGSQDIAFGRGVTQCRKFCDTFFEKFISFNPWQISLSFFCERYLTHHTSIRFNRIPQLFLNWYSFLCKNGPKTALFYLKIVKHLSGAFFFVANMIFGKPRPRLDLGLGIWPKGYQ